MFVPHLCMFHKFYQVLWSGLCVFNVSLGCKTGYFSLGKLKLKLERAQRPIACSLQAELTNISRGINIKLTAAFP